MPVKKFFLSDTSKFCKAIHSNNTQQFEKNLKKLMNQANENYDKIYRKTKNNPDIEKFNTCREAFSQIKSIIELTANFTPLINKLYFEAWISTLYSDVHALNLQVETETQLKELIGKIQAIEVNFEKLSAENKKFHLNLNIEGAVDLLKYIQNFENTWKINKIKLLADIYFNFGLTLEENSNLEKALIYFTQSKNSYNEAAKIAANSATNMNFKKEPSVELSKEKLVKAADQTQKKIQSLLNQKNSEESLKELRIHLQRIPDSDSKWTIINVSSPAPSIKERRVIKVKRLNEKTDLSLKIKRKSNEELTYPESKKPKIDPSSAYPKKIKFRWKIECEQLLKKIDEITIANYKPPSSSPNQHELIRFKASLASQYTIKIIEKLIFTNEKLDNTKKLDYLKKAERAFQNSLSFYNQAGLVREKGKVIQCQNLLISTINEFKTSIGMGSRTSEISLFMPKHEDLGTPKSKDFSTINIEQHQTEARIFPKEKFREFQHTYSTRYVHHFFSDDSLKENLSIDNLKIVCP